MRILFIRSNPVKPYPRLEKTCNSLLGLGHQIQVLGWDRNANYEDKLEKLDLVNGTIPITRLGIKAIYGGGLKKTWKALIKFEARIMLWMVKNRNSFDVIHAYDLDTGLIALVCAKLLGKKIVYDIPDYYVDSHGLSGTKIGYLVKKIEDLIINCSDTVIICSEKRKEQIKGTNPRRLAVIHNSPDDEILKNLNNVIVKSHSDKLKIVYVGILGKGRFIEEIIELVDRRNDVELHIAGFGELENYVEHKAANCNSIHYYGKLTYCEAISLTKQSDVIVAIYDPKVPNHIFAAPNKFYEALMLGKQIIMAKGTGMSDEVLEYNIGKVVDFTRDSLEIAINELIDEKDCVSSASKKAKSVYAEKYSWRKMELILKEVYDNL